VFNVAGARKSDGISFDTNILDIGENAVIMKQLEDQSVAIVIVYGVQQINCIRNKAGEIIEVSACSVFASVRSLFLAGGWPSQ
jgi:hypothetical protein